MPRSREVGEKLSYPADRVRTRNEKQSLSVLS